MSKYVKLQELLQEMIDSGEIVAMSAIITGADGSASSIAVSASPWSGYVSSDSGLSPSDLTCSVSQ
jgi:hypothetical protein